MLIAGGGGWLSREAKPSIFALWTLDELETGVLEPRMLARELSPDPEVMAFPWVIFPAILILGAKRGPGGKKNESDIHSWS